MLDKPLNPDFSKLTGFPKTRTGSLTGYSEGHKLGIHQAQLLRYACGEFDIPLPIMKRAGSPSNNSIIDRICETCILLRSVGRKNVT